MVIHFIELWLGMRKRIVNGKKLFTFSKRPSTSSSKSLQRSFEPLASRSSLCPMFAASLEYEVSLASRRDSSVRHCLRKSSYVDISRGKEMLEVVTCRVSELHASS